MNTLVTHLAEACRNHLLREKRLIAPSRRVAHQWLDQVTLAGFPVVNVRVETMRSLALRIVAGAPDSGPAAFLWGPARRIVAAAAWQEAMRAGGGYLSAVRTTPRLLALVERTLADLRMAGLSARDLADDRFEQPAKGSELRALLAAYEQELARRGLVDHAETMRRAARALRAEPSRFAGALLLVPQDLPRSAIEREFLESIPPVCIELLQADEPAAVGATDAATDLAALAWLPRPADAPPTRNDGTAKIVHAVGEINEVRQALRRVLAEEIPLDAVEILYSAEEYAAMAFETAQRLFDADAAMDLGIPVTFADGVPARLSRPGRLLEAWLEWIREDFPQTVLLRMLQAGLLNLPERNGQTIGTTAICRALRRVQIGFDRERYLARIDDVIRQAAAETAAREDDEGPSPGGPERHRWIAEATQGLRQLVEALLAVTPARQADARSVIHSAIKLMRDHAHSASRLDGLARQRLEQELRAMAEAQASGEAPGGFDAWEWLAELPGSLRVAGSGPRPGHLHVASIRSGGHSGRTHTFIVGLDDGRFPPSGLQDPLLLDQERRAIHADLPTAAQRVAEQIEGFSRLVCRLRGRVTLSFSCRDLVDGRGLFASPAVLSAFRILAGQPEGDHRALAAWLGPPASFAPTEAGECLDAAEWWMAATGARNAEALLAAAYPHLERGRQATLLRDSDACTSFDGLIEAPGPELDPRSPQGGVLSSRRLQDLGRCPLAYYYRYALKIEPRERLEVRPEQWLDALQFGTLLHAVLYDFVGGLIRDSLWPPDPQRDAPRMERIVQGHLDEWRRAVAPPSPAPYERQKRSLERAAAIFMAEQKRHGAGGRPVLLEAAIGMPGQGDGTAIDTPEPVALTLPGGSTVRMRARLDRIDQLDCGPATFRIVDYKSGGYTKPYDPPDMFDQGRLLQHVIYMAVAEAVLSRHLGREAEVDGFAFFFPGVRAHGRTIPFPRAIVNEGLQIVDRLCALSASGAFPATDKVEDCEYCDFRRACKAVHRDLEVVCGSTRQKRGDPAIAPFVELRRGK